MAENGRMAGHGNREPCLALTREVQVNWDSLNLVVIQADHVRGNDDRTIWQLAATSAGDVSTNDNACLLVFIKSLTTIRDSMRLTRPARQ